MAMCAKEMKIPFYVLAESFKFSRIYPLNQIDLPDEFKVIICSNEIINNIYLRPKIHQC